MKGRELAVRLWELFDKADFDAVAPLLHPDFTAEWPQSRERMATPADFIAVNRNYPGRWRCRLRRIVEGGNEVVTDVEVSDGKTTVHALSIFEVESGRIRRLTEYWADPFEAPAWRAAWIQRY